MLLGGESSNAFAAPVEALIATLQHPLSLLSQLKSTDQDANAGAGTSQSDQSAHHFRSPVTSPAGAERGRASTFNMLTRNSGASASTGWRQNLYTDHIDANVLCHCLQGLERQGVNTSDNALVRHNLVVFRNGDSAMQVSEGSICPFEFSMLLGRSNTRQSPHWPQPRQLAAGIRCSSIHRRRWAMQARLLG